MLTYYCPNCWSILQGEENHCPNCHFDLGEYKDLPYEKKLLLAVNHPIPSRRVIAIEILGKRGSTDCLDAFEHLLQKPDEDFYTLSAVIDALSRIDSPRAEQLLNQAAHHRSYLISKKAKRSLRVKVSS
jgi:HEAT repeat protein